MIILITKGDFIVELGEECDCGEDYLQCQVNIIIHRIIIVMIILFIIIIIIMIVILLIIKIIVMIMMITQDACCYPATISLYDLSANHSALPCARSLL